MKFIVVQTGARRGYAVAKILAQHGMLERLYTEIAGNHGLGRTLASWSWLPHLGERLARLAGRRIPDELLEHTETFGWLTLKHLLGGMLSEGDAAAEFDRHLRFMDRWGEAMVQAGFGGATHIFTMLGEGGTFVRAAKKRGLRIVADVYILLSIEKILDEERRNFPDWENESATSRSARDGYLRNDVLLECSDLFLCPSEAVQADLVANWGVAREHTAVVPYGTDPKWLNLKTRPQPGRILFVGTADLRKGIHYLAAAAEELRRRGRNYQFRIAGTATKQVRAQPSCKHLTFLGRVPRAEIHHEYELADLLVLPSLGEGSAQVTYEAMASGIPLIATPAAGSVARDGLDGKIIPERDPVALADAIEALVENRQLRDQCAANARERAREFIWDRYGERLTAALASHEGQLQPTPAD